MGDVSIARPEATSKLSLGINIKLRSYTIMN